MLKSTREQPIVSFIVASYNYGRYIRTTLQSILNQTVRDFEIIVIDDGSADDSLDVIRSFNDPRIHLHVNESNLGVAPTYNKGVSLARGRYVTFVDSDDWIEPTKIEEQLEFLRQHPATGIVGTYVKAFDENGNRHADADNYETYWNQPHDFSSVASWIGQNRLNACSALIVRSVFDRIGMRDVTLDIASDYEFWVRACSRGCRFGVVASPLLCYRVHAKNASMIDRRTVFLELSYVLQNTILPTIASRAAPHLIPACLEWVVTHEEFGLLDKDQAYRLLGMLATPTKCMDCRDFKKRVLHDDDPSLRSLGERFHAMSFEFANKPSAYDHEIALRDHHIAMRDQAIATRDHEIAVLTQQVEIRDRELAVLGSERIASAAHTRALQAERDDLTARNSALLASTSWRLTKPIRVIGAALRRAAGRR